LTRLSDQSLAFNTWRYPLCLFAQALRFFGQTLFEWEALFETASLLHGAAPFLRKAGAQLAFSSPITATGPDDDDRFYPGRPSAIVA